MSGFFIFAIKAAVCRTSERSPYANGSLFLLAALPLPFPAFPHSIFAIQKKSNGGKAMDYSNYAKMSRKALLESFEQERQEWLAAGMSDEAISRVHFGEEDEDGRGGDYGVWLAERRRVRPDHKYAPGTPVAIDAVDPDSAWISGGRGGLDETEFNIDLEAALSKLSAKQKLCFVEVEINDRTQQEASKALGIAQPNLCKHIRDAKRKLKIFFSGGI
jgi:hypothetical protein